MVCPSFFRSAVTALVLLASCTPTPSAGTTALAPPPSSSITPVPSPPEPLFSALPSASAAAPVAAPTRSASSDADAPGWSARCAAHVEAARQNAAALQSAFRGASVDVEKALAERPGRAHVSLSMFPPTFKVGGFDISVTRLPAADRATSATIWGLRAESLHGSYHAMFLRTAGVGDAFISFDGWNPQEAQALAAIFKVAADLCLEDK